MDLKITQYIPVLSIHSDIARNPNGILEDTNAIELRVSYNEGGRNWMSGAIIPRGYYLHANPVERNEERGLTGTILGSGTCCCLLEVSRRSDKQQEIACKMAELKAPELLEWCRKEYGLCVEIPWEFFPNAKKRPIPKDLKKPEKPKNVDPAPFKPIRSMKLLTAEIIRKLEKHPFGSQEGKGDNVKVIVKFFGGGAYTFLVTEGEKQENGDWMLFGKATHGYGWEWGYTMLSEIENMKFPPFGLGAERDMYVSSDATVGDLAV